jgi:hypothetical protein
MENTSTESNSKTKSGEIKGACMKYKNGKAKGKTKTATILEDLDRDKNERKPLGEIVNFEKDKEDHNIE